MFYPSYSDVQEVLQGKFDNFQANVKASKETKLCIAGRRYPAKTILSLITAIEDTAITAVDFSVNQIGDDDIVRVVQVLGLTNVIDVNFSHCPLSEKGMKACAKALYSSKIQRISLQNCGGIAGVRAFVSALAFDKVLKKVDLRENDVDREGAIEILQRLSVCQVEEIDFSCNRIGSVGLDRLARAMGFGVKRILLDHNLIDDNGAVQFCQVLRNRNWGLEHLSLRGNSLSSSGVEKLLRALAGTTVTSLDLSGNTLGDSGVYNLFTKIECTNIKSIVLRDVGIGEWTAHDWVVWPAKTLNSIIISGKDKRTSQQQEYTFERAKPMLVQYPPATNDNSKKSTDISYLDLSTAVAPAVKAPIGRTVIKMPY